MLASLFVWVGAQHLRTDLSQLPAPPIELAATLDAPPPTAPAPAGPPRVERRSASLSLESPVRDPLVEVLRRVCALLDRVPPVLRAGAGSEVCR